MSHAVYYKSMLGAACVESQDRPKHGVAHTLQAARDAERAAMPEEERAEAIRKSKVWRRRAAPKHSDAQEGTMVCSISTDQ
jgi:hypothetical protein